MAAMLFFAVVYRIPANAATVRTSFLILMEISVVLALTAVLWQFNKYMAMFLAYSFLSSFYPTYGPMSFYAQKMVVMGCLWYFLILYIRPKPDTLLNAICFAAMINLVVQSIQVWAFPLDFNFWLNAKMPVGMLSNLNETSALYVFSIPAFLAGPWFRTARWAVVFPLFGIYFSQSFLGYIALAIGIIIFFSTQAKKKWYLPAIIAFIICVMAYVIAFVPMYTLNLRIMAWKSAWPYLVKHWIMGAGIGHWKVLFAGVPFPPNYKTWDTAHNEFFQLWAEMGVFPLLLIAGYVVNVLRRYRKEAFLSVLAVGMIAAYSLGSWNWRIAPLAMVSLTWMAILEMQLRIPRKIKLRDNWVSRVKRYKIIFNRGETL